MKNKYVLMIRAYLSHFLLLKKFHAINNLKHLWR
ncbi:hypothetical protein CKO_00556 [Citrobacter koseri ATCC BAA-895]|uniref:Uncharacterized protein n=1 Tax=Citrobacter koseri (strain ATCC BAA-895 / CDC 4225-83 / SGSC4696) TaxID=290338 RepID=A8ADZ8_CITK8|nr:hypothetical protein CKO_00556 [Citrobacter koseri ATCC BAA-895]